MSAFPSCLVKALLIVGQPSRSSEWCQVLAGAVMDMPYSKQYKKVGKAQYHCVLVVTPVECFAVQLQEQF